MNPNNESLSQNNNNHPTVTQSDYNISQIYNKLKVCPICSLELDTFSFIAHITECLIGLSIAFKIDYKSVIYSSELKFKPFDFNLSQKKKLNNDSENIEEDETVLKKRKRIDEDNNNSNNHKIIDNNGNQNNNNNHNNIKNNSFSNEDHIGIKDYDKHKINNNNNNNDNFEVKQCLVKGCIGNKCSVNIYKNDMIFSLCSVEHVIDFHQFRNIKHILESIDNNVNNNEINNIKLEFNKKCYGRPCPSPIGCSFKVENNITKDEKYYCSVGCLLLSSIFKLKSISQE